MFREKVTHTIISGHLYFWKCKTIAHNKSTIIYEHKEGTHLMLIRRKLGSVFFFVPLTFILNYALQQQQTRSEIGLIRIRNNYFNSSLYLPMEHFLIKTSLMWLLKTQDTKRPTIKKKTNEFKRCVHETMIWMPLVVTWRITKKQPDKVEKKNRRNFTQHFIKRKWFIFLTYRKLFAKNAINNFRGIVAHKKSTPHISHS